MPFDVKKCKSCGAEIVWLKTCAGKNMPVNVPKFADGEIAHEAVTTALEFNPYYMISHFSTCPNSNQHRRSK